jgi:hypothetical protein
MLNRLFHSQKILIILRKKPEQGLIPVYGLMLSLNPDVSDVVERFGMKGPDGVSILVMGTVVKSCHRMPLSGEHPA